MSFIFSLITLFVFVWMLFNVGIPLLGLLVTFVLFWPRTMGIILGSIVSFVILYNVW